MDACVPYFASNLESEPVSPPDTPAGSAMHCGYAPVVEFGPVVERGILGSVATDASRTPLAGAPHKDAGPAAEGADYPGESTASHGFDCKLTELQHEIPTVVPTSGSGHDFSAHDASRETAETAENRISGTEGQCEDLSKMHVTSGSMVMEPLGSTATRC